jgi:soluble epoxide hydrolase/lipid-phosphate phosphatase
LLYYRKGKESNLRFMMFYQVVLVALAITASAASAAVRTQFTTRDGTTYVYDYAAAQHFKPTVLLLHGYPSSRQDWRYQVQDLSATGYGVLAPDLLGYGESDLPADIEAYHMKRLSGHLTEIIDNEKLATVVGVGHDKGSTFLSALYVWAPKRFEKLAFLSVGYSPPGTFTDIDAINAQSQVQLGYMQLGYWYFFNSYDADELIRKNVGLPPVPIASLPSSNMPFSPKNNTNLNPIKFPTEV